MSEIADVAKQANNQADTGAAVVVAQTRHGIVGLFGEIEQRSGKFSKLVGNFRL